MESLTRKLIPAIIGIALMVGLFWQFFVRGYVPMPASFMAAWYEPWKTQYSASGVPTIPHKAVGDDIFRQIYPFRTLATELERHGTVPLWNPYNGSGQPLLATLHTGIGNPLSLLGFFGPVSGWTWFVMLQVPFLFLATYWYVRSLGASREGSIMSGVVIALSGVSVSRYMYGDYVYALIGLPLLLGAIERKRIWMVPFVTAGILVSVQPQISAYMLMTAFVYLWIRGSPSKIGYLAGILFGVGFAAYQLIPTIELYALANVTAGSSAFIFDRYLMPIRHLITILIPNYFGNIGTYNFWGTTDYVETVTSIGMIPVLLALFVRKGRIRSFFGWTAVLTILLTLDWVVPRFISRLPIPILSTSIPTRISIITAFCIAVLAGMGLDAKPKWKTVAGVGALGIALLLLTRTFSCPPAIVTCTRVAFRNSMFELGAFAVGSGILLFPRIRKMGLIILVTAVGLYNGWKFLPMSPPEYVGATHPLIAAFRSVFPERVAGVGSAALATDFATQYRYLDTNYYDPLFVRRYGELVSFVNTGDRLEGLTRSDIHVVSDATVSAVLAARRDRFWDLTGVSALAIKKTEADICRPADPALSRGCEVVWEDADWKMVRRETALPRAFLTGEVNIPGGDEALLNAMFSKQANIGSVAFAERPEYSLHTGVEPGTATIRTYSANEVRIGVEANHDALLVLSDTYDPGWRAFVDGKERQIVRVNYAFRGIFVPQGSHVVDVYYRPASAKWGMILSVTSLFGWVIAMTKRKS